MKEADLDNVLSKIFGENSAITKRLKGRIQELLKAPTDEEIEEISGYFDRLKVKLQNKEIGAIMVGYLDNDCTPHVAVNAQYETAHVVLRKLHEVAHELPRNSISLKVDSFGELKDILDSITGDKNDNNA